VSGFALAAGIRRRGEQYFNRLWYDNAEETSPNFALKSLSRFYTLIASQRFKHRLVYERPAGRSHDNNNKPRLTSALVVVIGNITVGGVGKTPLIIALAKALQDRGLRIGIVSRGYGGSYTRSSSSARMVTADDDASVVGDEPLLIVRQVDCPLAIARRRNAAIAMLDQMEKPDVILSDDGLQHYAMGRDMEFLVIDGERGLGNQLLLPAGPLREPIERMRSVDALILNGNPDPEFENSLGDFSVPVYRVGMQADQFRPVNTAAQALATNNASGNGLPEPVYAADRIFMVAGIGHPEKFFQQCRSLLGHEFAKGNTPDIIEFALEDHHTFSRKELVKMIRKTEPADAGDCEPGKQVMLVTEKDAVKLSTIGDTLQFPIYAVGLRVELDTAMTSSIAERFQQSRNTA